MSLQAETNKLKLGMQAALADLAVDENSVLPHLLDIMTHEQVLDFMFVFGGQSIYIPPVGALVDSLSVACAARDILNQGEVNRLAALRAASSTHGVPIIRIEKVLRVLEAVQAREDKMSADKKDLLAKVGLLDFTD